MTLRYYKISELETIKATIENHIQNFVPKLFSTIEYTFEREGIVFTVRVPRKYVSKVSRRLYNWYHLKNANFEGLKFQVRTFPGIE
jgi:hypothetical protein